MAVSLMVIHFLMVSGVTRTFPSTSSSSAGAAVPSLWTTAPVADTSKGNSICPSDTTRRSRLAITECSQATSTLSAT